MDRDINTLPEAIALLDEWIAAYRELERQAARWHRTATLKQREHEMAEHRTAALENDLAAAEAEQERDPFKF